MSNLLDLQKDFTTERTEFTEKASLKILHVGYNSLNDRIFSSIFTRRL